MFEMYVSLIFQSQYYINSVKVPNISAFNSGWLIK